MTKIFGYVFREMTRSEWDGFAGAEPGTLICTDLDGVVLLWDHSSDTLSEITYDGKGEFTQYDWQRGRVV